MANIQIETGFQLLTRLSIRPSIENVYPNLFTDGGPHNQQVIEITGNSATGKTFLLTEIIAKCLLPNNIYDINIGGKNAGVILINTDHHFHIFNLVNTMTNIIKNCQSDIDINSEKINDIIKESLTNFIILNCFDSQQFYITFQNLEKIVSNNQKLSLIVLDSISSYYWADRLTGGIKKVEKYQTTILKTLQDITNHHKLVIMFTNTTAKGESSEESWKSLNLDMLSYKVELEKVLDGKSFRANVTLPDNTNFTKQFYISELIQWL